MRFGLRARVVAAVVLVTTTATAVMAYAAYQLQASDSVERYSTAAMAEMSSLWSRTSPWVDQAPAEDKLMVIANEATVDQTEWLVVAKKAGAPFSVARSSDTGQLAPVFRVLSDGKLAQLPAAPPQPVDLPDKEQILKNVEAEVLPHLDGPAFHGTAITTDPRTGKKILVIGIYFFKTDYYLVEMFDLSVLDTDLAALRWKLVYIAAGVSVLGIGAAPITVTIEDTGSEVVVRVRDSGPGVPEDLLPILFDRFVRGDHARQTGGNGLGLSIARENTSVHGGTLTVHNDGGAVFTLTLPHQTTGILNND